MGSWDVFHSSRLELERGLDDAALRAGIARGAIVEDDLIRPSGSGAPWTRIGDLPALPGAPASPPPPTRDVEPPPAFLGDDDEEDVEVDVEIDEVDEPPAPAPIGPHVVAEHDVLPAPSDAYGEYDLDLRTVGRRPALEASSVEVAAVNGSGNGDGEIEEYDPLEEDEAVAEFTLSRGAPEKVEELDLAAMVDVAFQLVLFFLVTATTVLYKTLEVPKPNPESAVNTAAAQGRPKTLDELKDDYILVEIDSAGAVEIDNEPVPSDVAALAERLRSQRERTGRKAMLLSADFTTPHRSAVLAYDAANDIGLAIAIARPPRPNP